MNKNDEMKFDVIRNENLVCKDCRWKKDDAGIPANVCRCYAYNIKPLEVLNGGKCDKYIKNDTK